MKSPLRLLGFAWSFLVFTVTLHASASGVLIENVRIIDGTGRAPFRGSLLVREGRIAAVVHEGEPRPDTRGVEVQNGEGKFALPGFVDLLTHISFRSAIDAREPYSLSCLFGDVQQRPVAERLAIYKGLLKVSLERGVTTFIDSISSLEDLARLSKELDTTHYPNFRSLGPILSPRDGHPYVLDDGPLKYEVPTGKPDGNQLARVKADLELWFRRYPLAGLKIAVDGPAEDGHAAAPVPESVIRAVAEVASAHNVPLFFISMTDEGIQRAARAGARVKLGPPIVLSNPELKPRAATWKALQDHGVALLSITANWGGNLWRYMEDGSDLRPNHMPLLYDRTGNFTRLPEEVRTHYQSYLQGYQRGDDSLREWVRNAGQIFSAKALSLLEEAHSRHIPILPADDAGSFWVFHGNLWMELADLRPVASPLEILSAATLGAARIVHLDSQVGSLEPGKLADIVVLNSDPTQDLAHVRDVAYVLKSGERVGSTP